MSIYGRRRADFAYSDVKHAVNCKVEWWREQFKTPLRDVTLLKPDRSKISIGNFDYVFLTRLHLNCPSYHRLPARTYKGIGCH